MKIDAPDSSKRTTVAAQQNAKEPSAAQSFVAKRRKLWDLPASCHCLVIGTCLSLAEVKAIAKRCQYDTDGKSDYALHQFFVGQACYPDSKIAKGCQKLLEKKFRTAISQAKAAISEADVLTQWQHFSDGGQVSAGLWSLVTHPHCTSAVVEFLYGEIHMMSHLSGASVHRKAAEVPALKHEVDILRNKLNAQRLAYGNKLKSYRYEVIRLENLNQSLADQVSANKPQATDQPDLLSKQDSDHLKCMLRETNQLLRSSRSQLQKSNALADERLRQLEGQRHDMAQLEQLVNKLISDDNGAAESKCDHSLSGKCVLLLGGMPSQCEHFKAFVESNNGDFLHHDGGVESSHSQIDQLVRRADAVFCPVEQISHSAMLRAKKLCKNSRKPLVFLPKSSLSAFVSGIRTIQ